MEVKFSQNLKKLRKSKGYSQEALAKKLGLTRTTISKYENEIAEPSLSILVALSQIFNVSCDFLITGYRKPQDELRDMLGSLTPSEYVSWITTNKKVFNNSAN